MGMVRLDRHPGGPTAYKGHEMNGTQCGMAGRLSWPAYAAGWEEGSAPLDFEGFATHRGRRQIARARRDRRRAPREQRRAGTELSTGPGTASRWRPSHWAEAVRYRERRGI